jgi:uncharacterized protein YdeI (BOF family)
LNKVTYSIITASVLILIAAVLFPFLTQQEKKNSKTKEAQGQTLKITKLKTVINTPDEFKNKAIILEGHFANICCQNCFAYKEGIESLEIVSEDENWHHFKSGTPVRVYGIFNLIEKKSPNGGFDIFYNLSATKIEKR